MCEEASSSLASQCLVFCQTLPSQGLAFNFSLNLGNSFSFSLDTRMGAPVKPMTGKKKTSPSTQRRNNRRRKQFLESKQTESQSAEPNKNVFSCDICDFSATSRKDLNGHVVRNHKDIEQLDGHTSLNSTVTDCQKEDMAPELTLPEKEVDSRIKNQESSPVQMISGGSGSDSSVILIYFSHN